MSKHKIDKKFWSDELTDKLNEYGSYFYTLQTNQNTYDVMKELSNMFRYIEYINNRFKLSRNKEVELARGRGIRVAGYFNIDAKDFRPPVWPPIGDGHYTQDELNDLESNYTVKPDHDNEGQSRPPITN